MLFDLGDRIVSLAMGGEFRPTKDGGLCVCWHDGDAGCSLDYPDFTLDDVRNAISSCCQNDAPCVYPLA